MLTIVGRSRSRRADGIGDAEPACARADGIGDAGLRGAQAGSDGLAGSVAPAAINGGTDEGRFGVGMKFPFSKFLPKSGKVLFFVHA